MTATAERRQNENPWRRHLALATASFFVCFAAWGLVSGLIAPLRARFHLERDPDTALLVAVPVLLGALARLPLGIAADRFGGRARLRGPDGGRRGPDRAPPDRRQLPARCSASRSSWAWPARRSPSASATCRGGRRRRCRVPRSASTALGNLGQSAAVFLGPLVGAQLRVAGRVPRRGRAAGPVGDRVRRAGAQRAPWTPCHGSRRARYGHARRRQAWALACFYFLTFGGFVAFSVYLPTLAARQLRLDAGGRRAPRRRDSWCWRRSAGRSAARWPIASAARACCARCSSAIMPFTLLLAWRSMVPFTVGALGCAALMGLGNGAVFKLVPQYFPRSTGTVTGLVGAMGGLGGFFPPLRARASCATAWASSGRGSCSWRDLRRRFTPQRARLHERAAAQRRGAAVACSRPALGQPIARRRLARRWRRAARRGHRRRLAQPGQLRRGAGRLHVRRRVRDLGRRLPLRGLAAEAADASVSGSAAGSSSAQRAGPRRCWRGRPRLAATHIFAQTFIRRRSRLRWWAHQLIFWGCLLAVAITFPLVFGWVHFRTAPQRSVHLRHLPVRLSRRVVSARDAVRLARSSTASTWRRCWSSPASRSRSARRLRDRGALARADLRSRLLAADPAVRDLGHRPGADGLHAVAARRALLASWRSSTRSR